MSSNVITLTRQELIDELADLKVEYQFAREAGNRYAMQSIVKDMMYCEAMINK